MHRHLIAAMLVVGGATTLSIATRPSSEILQCSIINSTSITCAPGESCKGTHRGKEATTVKLVGALSDEPFLIGNVGNIALDRLSASDEAVYLQERVPSGAIVLWVFIKKSLRLFQLKAGSFANADVTFSSLYQCVPLKE